VRRPVLVACAAAVVLALVAASAPVALAAATTGSIDWRACDGNVECAAFDVPASYDDPAGAQVSVSVARIPAGDPAERIGVLVVNPGGPGISAVDALPGLAAALPSGIGRRFDLVAFDPRGTGGSARIDCDVPMDPVFDSSFAPTSDEAHAELVSALRAVAAACASSNGDLLAQVSTVDAARDMDALRAAMGETRLNYLGFSYGTYLGALYAALFPDRVRAIVLDGAVDPSITAEESTLLQARGFEANLDRFFSWCAAHDDCAFHAGADPARAYDALRRRVSARTGAGDGATRVLNDTRFDAAVLLLLYRGAGAYPELAAALADADGGDEAALLALADRFLGRGPGGSDDGTVEAFWAIGCLDDPSFGNVAETADLAARARRLAPRVGEFVVNFSLACAVWPTRGSARAVAPSIAGAAPAALVVGTVGDPATPLASAKRLARALGDASLVVAPGDQHTVVASGNDCVDGAVASYLSDPRDRRPRTRC
jgi:pimeloyl-ACP methyl ester carboxylesterase